jgi:chromosome segregation ATPase
MKSIFPGHFKHDDNKLKQIWANSLFVFDANILLNLYRYSDDTRKYFLNLMEDVKERSFLPHQAAQEYLKNRPSTIEEQSKSYSDNIKSIEEAVNRLKKSTQHPFVKAEIMTKLDAVFGELKKELNASKTIHTKRYIDDDIKDSLGLLFEGRTGNPYDEAQLEEIITQGELRYEQKLPPGYMDAKTKSVNKDCTVLKERCRPYGDLIVWLQLLEKAKEKDTSVIFVTDDSKEDWWEITKNKITIGPRPELTEEFVGAVKKDFHMYTSEQFLELADKYLGVKATSEMKKEVQEVSQREAEKSNTNSSWSWNIEHSKNSSTNEYKNLLNINSDIELEINSINDAINDHLNQIKNITFKISQFTPAGLVFSNEGMELNSVLTKLNNFVEHQKRHKVDLEGRLDKIQEKIYSLEMQMTNNLGLEDVTWSTKSAFPG